MTDPGRRSTGRSRSRLAGASGGEAAERRDRETSPDSRQTGPSSATAADPREWNETWALAVAFGLASVPWTYAFVAALDLPLWPSFVASASFFAAGGGLGGLIRGYLANAAGIAYAVATLAFVDAIGGGAAALSVVVGAFMLLASLHAFVPRPSFTPGAFFVYATTFGVHAAGDRAFGVPGLAGEATAAVLAMLLGASIGLAVERVASTVA